MNTYINGLGGYIYTHTLSLSVMYIHTHFLSLPVLSLSPFLSVSLKPSKSQIHTYIRGLLQESKNKYIHTRKPRNSRQPRKVPFARNPRKSKLFLALRRAPTHSLSSYIWAYSIFTELRARIWEDPSLSPNTFGFVLAMCPGHQASAVLASRTIGYVRNNYVRNTGWRRPIGCLKLQFIFRKRATNYRALLRKMTHKDKASYGSSPPCMWEISDLVKSDCWNLQKCNILRYFDSMWEMS